MDTMPRPRPPHLHKETSRHGKTVWYVRVNRGPRIRITAAFGTDEFDEQYAAALEGKVHLPGKPASNTLAWLVDRYRDSSAWRDLSMATRRQRENILKPVLASAGREPFSAIDTAAIKAGRERRKDTPAQARHFVDTMRGLFKWAVEAEIAKSDPTQGVVTKKPKTKGFPVWTDEEIEKFEKTWPLGTRERLMLDVFLYTGLRRGDAAALGKQHIKDGVITLDTQKNGIRVTIPILPDLAQSLAVAPKGDLAIIPTDEGGHFTKESLGNAFREACRAAGIMKSAHGLRKAAATHAANRGATVAQLEAIFGWEGGQMASLYTRSADRRALAQDAMNKLSREAKSETSIPAPKGKVRESKKKG